MITDDVLPNWPPPANEPIGIERARAYNAWIRDHVGPLVAYGRERIEDRYPGAVTHTASVTVEQLARWTFSHRMARLNIGGVYAETPPGSFIWMDIHIRRDGRLECRPGLRMRE